jgi:hypothetical protein
MALLMQSKRPIFYTKNSVPLHWITARNPCSATLIDALGADSKNHTAGSIAGSRSSASSRLTSARRPQLPNWILNELLVKGEPRRIREFLQTTITQPDAINLGTEPDKQSWLRIHDALLNNNTVELGFFRIRFEIAWEPPLPVLDRLDKSFPDLTFEFEWIDFDAAFYDRLEKGELVTVPFPEEPPHSWNYPRLDPYQQGEPARLYSGLRLVAVLGPRLVPSAEATGKPVFLHRDITDAVLVLIQRLMEAALAAGDIPRPQLVESLLRSCGYDEFADRVTRRSRNVLIRPNEKRNDRK